MDDKGKPRQLHIEQALQCIDFDDVRPKMVESRGEVLIKHALFEIQKWNLDHARDVAPLGQFAVVCCLSGQLACANVDLRPGSTSLAPEEFFLVPALVAGSTTQTTRRAYNFVARNNSRTVAALCKRRASLLAVIDAPLTIQTRRIASRFFTGITFFF